jgi:urease accessory protein
VAHVFLQDRWRIRVAGQLVHAEETKLSGDLPDISSGPARLNSSDPEDNMIAFASMVLVAPDAGLHLEALRALPQIHGARWGASHVPIGATLAAKHSFTGGKLVLRFAARNGLTLRRAMIPMIETLARHALDIDGLPKVWRL